MGTGKVILFPDAKNANVFAMWAFAQVVTVGAGVASYPLDTVRRRLMMQSGLKGSEIQYHGTLDCFKKIAAQEGPAAFFKGSLPTFSVALVALLCSCSTPRSRPTCSA